MKSNLYCTIILCTAMSSVCFGQTQGKEAPYQGQKEEAQAPVNQGQGQYDQMPAPPRELPVETYNCVDYAYPRQPEDGRNSHHPWADDEHRWHTAPLHHFDYLDCAGYSNKVDGPDFFSMRSEARSGDWRCVAFDNHYIPYSEFAPTRTEAAARTLDSCRGANDESAECYIPRGYCKEL